MHRLKPPGYLSREISIIIYTACGLSGSIKGKVMENSCWNTVSQTPKQIKNPVYVFSEQGSRKPGSQIKPLYKVMDFKSQILLKAAISCWHYLLTPRFCTSAKQEHICNQELTVFYDMQCPYVLKNVDIIRQYCEMHDIPVTFHLIDTLEKAKNVPCVFNNWAVFYKGRFQTVNLLLDINSLARILKK